MYLFSCRSSLLFSVCVCLVRGFLRVKLINPGWIANGNLRPAECNEFKMAYLEHIYLFVNPLFVPPHSEPTPQFAASEQRGPSALWWGGFWKKVFFFLSRFVSFSPLHPPRPSLCNWTLASGSLKADLQLLWRRLAGTLGTGRWRQAGEKWLSRLNGFAPWRARAEMTGPLVLPKQLAHLNPHLTRFPPRSKWGQTYRRDQSLHAWIN